MNEQEKFDGIVRVIDGHTSGETGTLAPIGMALGLIELIVTGRVTYDPSDDTFKLLES